jgi:hypothetical protein
MGGTMTSRAKWIAPALAISLLSALLAYSTLPPAAALAQNSGGLVCPLSDEQTQNSIQAFDKIAKVFAGEPRCVNCHGAVNPFGADADKKHGGGKVKPVMKTEVNGDTGQPESIQDDEATFQQCGQCHSAFPGHWQIPPAGLSFVGKEAFTLCKLEHDFFIYNAEKFLEHIERDVDPSNPFIQEAFTGRKGLNDHGQSLATKYPDPPKGVTRQDLIQMAHDWVDAQGGKFQGETDCGCNTHHYAIGLKETGVNDRVLATGLMSSHADMSGQGDIPLTFKGDGSFTGEATLLESLTSNINDPIRDAVCSGKGTFPNHMKVTRRVGDADQGFAWHLQFSWIYDYSYS